MLAVIGTVPDDGFPLVSGVARLEGDCVGVRDRWTPVNRGTPALLAAAVRTAEALGIPAPFTYLVGDTGPGRGSQRLYAHLVEQLPRSDFEVLAFHYLLPDVDWHNRILLALGRRPSPPILIADAGFMYAAKMSGQARDYDLFTPDVGELAFLADEMAPHPFYTRGFILHEENRVPDLIRRAYAYENAARHLLVKGARDYVATRDGIQATVDGPSEEVLEAIGGTGDTLTGITAALIASGMEVGRAALLAARANRLAGHYARPTPATQVGEIIRHIPKAVESVLSQQAKRRS